MNILRRIFTLKVIVFVTLSSLLLSQAELIPDQVQDSA